MNKRVHELADIELGVCGGNEMAMIKLQSLMSQRQMALQMCTAMVRAMNASAGAIIKNLK